jgi:hypothetical protein
MTPSEHDGSMVERVARAIFDAENGLDGDTIGTIIHGDFRVMVRDGDKGVGDTMRVCVAAARAAIAAMREPPPGVADGRFSAARKDDAGTWLVISSADAWCAMIDAALSEGAA